MAEVFVSHSAIASVGNMYCSHVVWARFLQYSAIIDILNYVCTEWAKCISAFWLGWETGGSLPAA